MSRFITRRTALAGAAGLAIAAPGIARAQAWPAGPIKIICGTAPGGLTDIFSRAYGEYISSQVGVPVVVENRPGASGAIAAQAVKQAAPDGLTFILTISTTFFANRVLISNLQYDPDKDFKFISAMPAGHLPLLAHKSTRATNVKEFIEYAKTNQVSLGTYGPGSFPHTVTFELNRRFGLNIVPVHYRGEAPMWNDFVGGALQAGIGSYQGSAPARDTNSGRVIAVPMMRRMGKLPDVPTFAEQGIDIRVLQLKGWVGLFGPAALPDAIADRVSALMVAGGKTERIRKILDTFGIDEAALSRAESQKLYDEEGPEWVEATRMLGLTPS
ncbi:Bug family tripartite tricarboxylate transporter substrate binding protein [Phreatobacter sp.]|uniref:Bug family tripartite tricarboxylate transporter substrate binding protein n=1 Tax=Phreatobacter sp. TaxID=1966341 RepID=UPI003F6FFBF7